MDNRLLTPERIQEIAIEKQLVIGSINLAIQEQHDLTASFYEEKIREIENLIDDFIGHGYYKVETEFGLMRCLSGGKCRNYVNKPCTSAEHSKSQTKERKI